MVNTLRRRSSRQMCDVRSVGVCGRRERSRPGQDVRYDVGKENGASEIKILGHPLAPCALSGVVPPPAAGLCSPQRVAPEPTQCTNPVQCRCDPVFQPLEVAFDRFLPASCQTRTQGTHPKHCRIETGTWTGIHTPSARIQASN